MEILIIILLVIAGITVLGKLFGFALGILSFIAKAVMTVVAAAAVYWLFKTFVLG